MTRYQVEHEFLGGAVVEADSIEEALERWRSENLAADAADDVDDEEKRAFWAEQTPTSVTEVRS